MSEERKKLGLYLAKCLVGKGIGWSRGYSTAAAKNW